MKAALKRLLNAMDGLAAEGHDEVMDTDVREQMSEALEALLFQPQPGYELPEEFGMFTPEGNAKLRVILSDFLAEPEVLAAGSLPDAQARLDAFQDVEVLSDQGATFDEYFGYAEPY